MDERKRIVEIAQGEIGVSEPTGDDKYIDAYSAATGVAFARTSPWCQIFVWWCGDQAGVSQDTLPLTASCTTAMKWYKNKGVWKERGAYVPQAGDIVYFDWDQGGDADHVGIVERCDGTTLTDIEGNAGDAVKRKSYSLTNKQIRGYACPNYRVEEEPEEEPAAGYAPSAEVLVALEKLQAAGVIETPEYWKLHAGDLTYLEELLINLSTLDYDAPAEEMTVQAAIDRLQQAGAINTPAYWENNLDQVQYLRELLIKAAKRL